MIFLLTAVALLLAAGCSASPRASQATHVLEISQSKPLSGGIELEGNTLVRDSDSTALQANIDAAKSQSEKHDVIVSYLIEREEIDCVIKHLQSSLQEGGKVSCGGKLLVHLENEHGLLGVKELTEGMNALNPDDAKRLYILDHLHSLYEVNRTSRILQSVEQIKNSRSIPLLGTLVRAIHKFPVVYEGKELIPYSRIDSLIEDLNKAKTESERRSIAKRELSG